MASDGEAHPGSPYRSPAPVRRENPRTDDTLVDETWPVFAVLWLGSVARVIGGMIRHEVVGAELTIAALVIVFLPWRAAVALWQRHFDS